MRQWLLIAAKLAVSAGLLAFAFSRVNFDLALERAGRLDPWWVGAGIAIALLQTALVAARWRRIVSVCGAALPVPLAIRFTFIAMFFNQVLPSTVGGDAARIWLLGRTGAGWTKAAYSVLLDRFAGLLVLSAMVACGLYWSFGLIQDWIARTALAAIGLGGIAGGLAFVAAGAWPRFRSLKPLRHVSDLAVLARHMLFGRAAGPAVVGLSVLIHTMTAAIAWSMAQAAAASLDFVQSLLLVLPVVLIASVPVSIAGWGVRETALVLAFSYAGLPESDGLLVSVLVGAAMMATGLTGGLIWLATAGPRRIGRAMNAETDAALNRDTSGTSR